MRRAWVGLFCAAGLVFAGVPAVAAGPGVTANTGISVGGVVDARELVAAGIFSMSSLPCSAAPGGVEAAGVAYELAARCGVEVELLGERSAWATVFATPSGDVRRETSLQAVRTEVDGRWVDIDTDVVVGAQGLVVKAPVNEMTFGAGPGDVLARITREGKELVVSAPVELTEPVVDGSVITYPQVLPDVDLLVSVNDDGTGFNQVLRVNTEEAAANPVLASLEFGVEPGPGLAVKADGGAFVVVDGAGGQVFASPEPLMWDSTGAQAGPFTVPDVGGVEVAGPGRGDEIASVDSQVSSDSVVVSPDAHMLASEETVFPVYIDPGVSGGLYEWAVLQSGWATSASGYKFSGAQSVGLCSPASSSQCSRSSVERLVYEFTGMATVGGLSGAQVKSATFSVYGTHSWSCTATGVQLWRVPGINAGSTWANHAGTWMNHVATQNLSHKSGCAAGPRWIEWNVTSLGKLMADQNLTTMGIGLKAANESSMSAGWNSYRNDAKFSVTYDRPPSTPTVMATDPATPCVTGAGRPYMRSATPQLRVTLVHPDGQNVQANFAVYRLSDLKVLYNPAKTAAQASGRTHTTTVPAGILVDGQTYMWAAQGYNGAFGPAIKCEFVADFKAPTMPTVTAGGATVYTEDAVSGRVGGAGSFTFGSNGVADVVSYRYSFDTDALGSTATGAAPTVAYTPASPGSHRLYVQSVDRAGWTSPVKLYRFSVGFPGKAGGWKLDEGTGATAADSTVGASTLQVSGATWTQGLLAMLRPDDHALQFAGSGKAVSTGPVVATDKAFTVMAQVRADQVNAGGAVAISQAGQKTAAFRLGYLSSAACGGEPCWAFEMPGMDDAGASAATASDTWAVTNDWVHLTGVFDPGAGTISLTVCDPNSPLDLSTTTVPAQVNWSGGGAFQLGGGLGSPGWVGAIDDVRVLDGPADNDMISRACGGEDL